MQAFSLFFFGAGEKDREKITDIGKGLYICSVNGDTK